MRSPCNASLETFPQVTQMSSGGAPRRLTSSTKSASLLSKITLFARAASNNSRSPASHSPSSRKAFASIRRTLRNQAASCGGNCASSQSVGKVRGNCVRRRAAQCRYAALLNAGKREYRPIPNPENRQEFAPWTRHLRAFRGCQ